MESDEEIIPLKRHRKSNSFHVKMKKESISNSSFDGTSQLESDDAQKNKEKSNCVIESLENLESKSIEENAHEQFLETEIENIEIIYCPICNINLMFSEDRNSPQTHINKCLDKDEQKRTIDLTRDDFNELSNNNFPSGSLEIGTPITKDNIVVDKELENCLPVETIPQRLTPKKQSLINDFFGGKKPKPPVENVASMNWSFNNSIKQPNVTAINARKKNARRDCPFYKKIPGKFYLPNKNNNYIYKK